MSELLFHAFQALGRAPSFRETALVAAALRETGDREVLAMFEAASTDRDAFDAIVAVARAAGSSGFTALDLHTELVHPAPKRGG